jgi:hypothetical protein
VYREVVAVGVRSVGRQRGPEREQYLTVPRLGYNSAAMLPPLLRMRPGPGSRAAALRRRQPGAPDVDRAAARFDQ